MARFNPKWIIGRTIVGVDMRRFSTGRTSYGTVAHDPVITFDNGAVIYFTTEETEIGEYGTAITYVPPPPKKRRKRKEEE